MADFPQNLNDGDDFTVFPYNRVSSSSSRRFESINNCSSLFVDDFGPSVNFPLDEHFSSRRFNDLTRQFSAFSLLQRDHNIASVPAIPPPMFERLRQPIHSTSTTSGRYSSLSSNGGYNLAHNVTSYETRNLTSHLSDISSFQYHQQRRLAQNREFESILQLRARLLQFQNQQQQSHSQSLPSQRRSRVHVGTNYVPKSEGTGVFIPRIASASNTTAIDTTSHQSRRKQAARNIREAQMTRPTSRIATEQHEDCYCHVSPEMALPHEWTY